MTDPTDAGSRERVISVEEFRKLLRESPPNVDLFAELAALPAAPDAFHRKAFWSLQEAAHQLETYLDNFHARNNKAFVLFAELNASIRNLAVAGHTIGHVLVRYAKYGVEMPGQHANGQPLVIAFPSEALATMRSLARWIAALAAALHEEAGRLDVLPPPRPAASGAEAEVKDFRLHLPQDLGQVRSDDVAGVVAVLLNQYLGVAEGARRLRDKLAAVKGDLRAFVAEHLGETEARTYESAVHNLQSDYDTLVKPTQAHQRPELQRLRGHISLSYHLLEVVSNLVHFYERHEGSGKSGVTQEEIARLVPPDEILDRVVHFALRYAIEATLSAVPLVRDLLPQFVQADTLELELPDGMFLHARPLNLIVRIVRKHGKPVEIALDHGESTSASSLMGMILFVGRHPQRRKFTFKGDHAPLEHLRLLFASGLGERGLEALPSELAYLREA